ncbi:MAG: hypothetical protein HYX61_04245 [Gammaproteobacteria bacterium]|jgi:hypothetical protein|nr:hypothetical protein [Gammaproteobacteria bacterium]
MSAGHQIVGIVILLHAIYFLNRQRKPYFFGFTSKAILLKSQITKGLVIGLYLFSIVAALSVLTQDLYRFIQH